MVTMFFMWLLNFFSFSALQSLPFAAIAVVGALVPSLYFGRSRKFTILNTAITGYVTYLVIKLYVYFALPAHTGYLGGYGWHLFFALLGAAVGGVLAWFSYDRQNSDYNDSYSRRRSYRDDDQPQPKASRQPKHTIIAGFSGIALIILFFVVMLVVNLVLRSNTDQRAAIAHITQAPQSQTIPETDPNHIVMVTQSQAAYAGHQFIANAGNNLGSRYHTDPGSYTLQTVDKRLWWVAPLVYNSFWQQFSLFSGHEYDSPGYIAVDAEDPNGQTKIVTDYHIRYSPDGWYGANLQRYLYTHGYSNGDIVDPTLELNDQWQPFWTVTITQPALTVTGNSTVKALVVDAQSGQITAYDPGKQPNWVDRIMSSDHVNDLVSDWARYLQAPWINFSGAGEMKPAGKPELLYNNLDQPTWLIPVTSNNGSDASSVGIVLYSTDEQKGTFYPGLRGIGVGDAVSTDFLNAPGNIQKYQVESVQLYEIDGAPTWVAIYGQDHGNGTSSFTAIGLLDAKRLSAANVIFAQDKNSALLRYADWLANNEANSGNVSQNGNTSKEVTGKITRISWVLVNNVATFYFTIDSDSHLFTATTNVNSALPLMREGDTVKLTYLDTAQGQVGLRTLTDVTINR